MRICRIRLSEKTHATAKAIACDAVCNFWKQLGSCQAHRQSPFRRRFLRPPSTEAPSLRRSYPASSVLRASPPSQSARPFSRELPVDPNFDHRWDFPCCAWSPLPACRRHYPGRIDGNLFAHTIPSASAFPVLMADRLLHHCFRGLLSVHSRYGLHARQVAFATLCTRGFSSLVASTAALIATGWSEPVSRAGIPPLWTSAFHGAHENGVTQDLATVPAKSPMDGMRRFSEFSDVTAEQSIRRWFFDVVDD